MRVTLFLVLAAMKHQKGMTHTKNQLRLFLIKAPSNLLLSVYADVKNGLYMNMI